MTSRKSSGSMRAESAVEPTRSENINRDLATLGGVLRLWLGSGGGSRRCWSRAGHLGDGSQHLSAVPEQNADVLQVLIGQMSEYREINSVLSKTLSVLGHAELFEPVCNLLHRRRPFGYDDIRVLDRHGTKSTTRAKPVVGPRRSGHQRRLKWSDFNERTAVPNPTAPGGFTRLF